MTIRALCAILVVPAICIGAAPSADAGRTAMDRADLKLLVQDISREHGIDPKLAKGTAGVKRFVLEHRTSQGDWSRVDGDPRKSRRSISTSGTDDQHVRIRAVDKAGNVGPWTYAHVDLPEGLPRWM